MIDDIFFKDLIGVSAGEGLFRMDGRVEALAIADLVRTLARRLPADET